MEAISIKEVGEALKQFSGREKTTFTQGIKAGYSLCRMFGESVSDSILEIDRLALEQFDRETEQYYREMHEAEKTRERIERKANELDKGAG